uniref:Putative ovule protein n=1 Tax=Solanum chacoense TaxID=4108 RepID=A0A0V0HW90_SOLCH
MQTSTISPDTNTAHRYWVALSTRLRWMGKIFLSFCPCSPTVFTHFIERPQLWVPRKIVQLLWDKGVLLSSCAKSSLDTKSKEEGIYQGKSTTD